MHENGMKVSEFPCPSGIFYLKHGNGIFGRGMGKKRNKKLKKLDFYLHLFLILINKREL